MAVRLRMKLKRGSEELVLKALVSSGYETVEPEILLPLEMAEKLNLIPKLPEGSEVKEYSLADGSSTRLIRIPKAAKASVVEEDRTVGEVEVDVVVSERAEEALISDKLAGKLGIVALDFSEGLWCFKDEIGRLSRRSY